MIVTKIQRRLVVMGRLRIRTTDRSIGHNRFFLFSYFASVGSIRRGGRRSSLPDGLRFSSESLPYRIRGFLSSDTSESEFRRTNLYSHAVDDDVFLDLFTN